MNKSVNSQGATNIALFSAKTKKTLSQVTSVAALMFAFIEGHAFAQTVDDVPANERQLDKVTVTGSYLERKSVDTPVPLLVIDRTDIDNSGVNTLTDVVRNLTINTGSQFNTDERTQGGTTGTANFNLRGLGVGSTLVLVNGRRRPTSLVSTNQGSSFVDINALMPIAMLERVEILKDGAASLYGSDAVAGVVNFIVNRNYQGFEVEGGFRFADSVDSTRDIEASTLYGWQGDRGGFTLGISYLDRSLLTADEVGFGNDSAFTTLGNPGAFQPAFRPFTGPGVPLENRPIVIVGSPFADPACEANSGVLVPLGGGASLCGASIEEFVTFVADEQRIQAGFSAHYDIDTDTEFTLDVTFSNNETFRVAAPSFPLTSFPFVPRSNPGFVAGSAPGAVIGTLDAIPLPPTFVTGALFFGRAIPVGSSAASRNQFNYQTIWATAGLNGRLTDNWSYDIAATYARQKLRVDVPDILRDRFLAALDGRGGPNNDQYYSPFASSIGAAPGSPFYNDPAVIDDFFGSLSSAAKSDFLVLDAVTTGTLFEMGGRDVNIALGGQWRGDWRERDFSQEANDNRLLFLFGSPDTDFNNSVSAAFAEVSWPVSETLEVQTALRYEQHGGNIGDSLDPKIAVLWTPNKVINFRASYATAFRAPRSDQNEELAALTALERVIDPAVPSATARFVPVIRRGNPDLKAEQSDSVNFGVTYRPTDNLTFRIDHWRFDISDLVVGQTAQSLADSPDPLNIIRVPGVGSIERLEGTFFNAAQLKTNGVDLEVLYRRDFGRAGNIRVDAGATKIIDYKFREFPGEPLVQRVDQRNFATIASPTPDWRGNVAVNWRLGGHSLSATVHYIDSYINDEPLTNIPARLAENIDSQTTFDMQYVISLQEALGFGVGADTQLTFGAINIFDEAPPLAATENGLPFDTRVHDPRGRVIYARVKQVF